MKPGTWVRYIKWETTQCFSCTKDPSDFRWNSLYLLSAWGETPRSAVADGNLVPGNGELALDVLRLCAKEKHTCPWCSPEPCKFSRSAGWELAWEAHRPVRCYQCGFLVGELHSDEKLHCHLRDKFVPFVNWWDSTACGAKGELCPGISWSIRNEQGVASGVGQHSFDWVISSPFSKQTHPKSGPILYC